jgi:hypothetical protein
MKKFWVLLIMLTTSVTAHAQKALKPVMIKVITKQQKTVTGFLYSISDSTISLSTNSKIKWEQLQSNEVSYENAGASADSDEQGVFSNHILITTFSFREIDKVKTPIRNAAIFGMIGGALIGVRAGTWVGTAIDANNTDNQNSAIPLTVGFLALNGAIIGGFILPHHRTFWVDSDEQSFQAMIDHFRSKYCFN